MELKKTITRSIESRQAKIDKRNGVSVSCYNLQGTMDELLSKGKVNVGGRQTCSKTDPSWDFYMAWIQVVNIFNKYQKDMKIEQVNVKIEKPGGAFSDGYWQEKEFTLVKL